MKILILIEFDNEAFQRRYTYECPFAVKIGQRVIVPTPDGEEQVSVVGLDSAYTGACKKVIALVED